MRQGATRRRPRCLLSMSGTAWLAAMVAGTALIILVGARHDTAPRPPAVPPLHPETPWLTREAVLDPGSPQRAPRRSVGAEVPLGTPATRVRRAELDVAQTGPDCPGRLHRRRDDDRHAAPALARRHVDVEASARVDREVHRAIVATQLGIEDRVDVEPAAEQHGHRCAERHNSTRAIPHLTVNIILRSKVQLLRVLPDDDRTLRV